ncbi:unnamed protein product, partial [Polarella glacialis]
MAGRSGWQTSYSPESRCQDSTLRRIHASDDDEDFLEIPKHVRKISDMSDLDEPPHKAQVPVAVPLGSRPSALAPQRTQPSLPFAAVGASSPSGSRKQQGATSPQLQAPRLSVVEQAARRVPQHNFQPSQRPIQIVAGSFPKQSLRSPGPGGGAEQASPPVAPVASASSP